MSSRSSWVLGCAAAPCTGTVMLCTACASAVHPFAGSGEVATPCRRVAWWMGLVAQVCSAELRLLLMLLDSFVHGD